MVAESLRLFDRTFLVQPSRIVFAFHCIFLLSYSAASRLVAFRAEISRRRALWSRKIVAARSKCHSVPLQILTGLSRIPFKLIVELTSHGNIIPCNERLSQHSIHLRFEPRGRSWWGNGEQVASGSRGTVAAQSVAGWSCRRVSKPSQSKKDGRGR